MPAKLVHRKSLMPVSRNNGTLVVATGDPFDVYALDELQTLTGLRRSSRCWPARARSPGSSSTHFGVGGETVAALVQERGDESRAARGHRGRRQRAGQAGPGGVGRQAGERDPDRGRQRAGQRHPHRARREGASASGTGSTACSRRRCCRRRSTGSQAAIISRIKIMARLNIAEKRLPQDGRIKMRVQGREIDVRVSIIPMVHGEGIVMRLLDKGRMVFNLANCRHAAGHVQDVQAADRPAARHRPGHRADRLGQVARRCTRPSTRSRTRRPRSSRSRTRSSTSSRASARSRRTRRSA